MKKAGKLQEETTKALGYDQLVGRDSSVVEQCTHNYENINSNQIYGRLLFEYELLTLVPAQNLKNELHKTGGYFELQGFRITSCLLV